MNTLSPILGATGLEDLLAVKAENMDDIITQDEVTHILRLADCFWQHSGKPEDPHAILTSGQHSNGFVNVLVALTPTPICKLFGTMIGRLIRQRYPELTGPKVWVIGSAYAAIDLSKDVANELGAQHGVPEKIDDGQVWRRFQIPPDATVIQVEELVTTLKTLAAVRKAIIDGNGGPVTFAPFVVTLVNRSPLDKFEGSPIISLAHYDIQTWEPETCPLCDAGSEAIKPKVPTENWARLTSQDKPGSTSAGAFGSGAGP